MRINATPVEAYRQSGQQLKNRQAEFDLNKAAQQGTITLPGMKDDNSVSVKAAKSPSILAGVLSSEEKTALIEHFARYGDSPESTRIYGTNAKVGESTLTGLKVDLTA
ncbi:MAG: hypothetical protein R3F48_11575 [Candidatus Zixiibacteriota bacterium]